MPELSIQPQELPPMTQPIPDSLERDVQLKGYFFKSRLDMEFADKDNKISEQEYDMYLQEIKSEEGKIPVHNVSEQHLYIHFDATVLYATGIVAITFLITQFIRSKSF